MERHSKLAHISEYRCVHIQHKLYIVLYFVNVINNNKKWALFFLYIICLGLIPRMLDFEQIGPLFVSEGAQFAGLMIGIGL